EILETVTEAEAATGSASLEPPVEARADTTYTDLIRRIEELGQVWRHDGTMRINYQRSAAAERAVLLRSGGCCEGPRCTGMPLDADRRGDPLLVLDHVEDVRRSGGADHPRNMVALCPNCHACKARGSMTALWRRELLQVAVDRHNAKLRAALALT